MNKLEALTALRDKVKAGVADESKRGEWPHKLFYDAIPKDSYKYAVDAYHGSLDAAKALHEAVLHDWMWAIDEDEARLETGDIGKEWTYKHSDATSTNPARAWLLAILEALIAQEQDT